MEKQSDQFVIEVIDKAIKLQHSTLNALTPEDKHEQFKYAKMVEFPEDKILLMRLMDESTQITNPKLLVNRIKHLHKQYGILNFLTWWEKLLFLIMVTFGGMAPTVTVPVFKRYLRKSTSKVIINEAPSRFYKHLDFRRKDQIGQNVNLIGEVVLGEDEALKRYKHYMEVLTNPRVSYISIKISGIISQLHPLNYQHAREILIERLSNIYRQAMKYPSIDDNGNHISKFINLDMEEYKDVELTFDVFTSTLGLEEFKGLYAGIVLQAYIPESITYQKKLIEWAQNRVKQGGSPIKMRLVKGANLQMEKVISSLRGWTLPIYETKIESDANYLRMIDLGFRNDHAPAVHIGIASHNIFSIAYAQTKAAQQGIEKYVSFEMLEGMANNLVRAMHRLKYKVVLYTPVVTNENFLNAVSYLVRRLDENTALDNFLSHSFHLQVGDKSWEFLLDQFQRAIEIKDQLSDQPRRLQNRTVEQYEITPSYEPFKNEPDTNFDLHQNRDWAKAIVDKWRFTPGKPPVIIPVQIGNDYDTTTKTKIYSDHSQDKHVIVYQFHLTSQLQLEQIINIADQDPANWRKMTGEERHQILAHAAQKFRENRNNLIGCMMAVTGKTMMEGDVEVSEAIDFLEYYPRTAKYFQSLENIEAKGKGVILVIPPWNFPLAIPVGGVVAGLSAGNTVIIKPASASAPVAFEFVKLMHEAGVPKEALQLVLPEERESLDFLTKHPSIKHIIFTGGTETAYNILDNNHKVSLAAETGGKNAIVLTAYGDRDIAIKSVIYSAFGNAGQKCSACSLLLLQKEIFDDAIFKSKLKNAIESLNVGFPWNLSTEIGPMIAPQKNNKELMHAIENIEEGESWLIEPVVVDDKQYLMKPAVKWGVKRNSYTFKTELFAPLLAVASFNDLHEAIDMVNSTGYGLTSGLISLNEEEQKMWRDGIEAGNLYINRGITGAIVQRQPFGGMKQSAFGSGVKAGGPNYVSCFMDFHQKKVLASETGLSKFGLTDKLTKAIESTTESNQIAASIESYKRNYEETFSKHSDVSNIIGEENYLRYLPAKDLHIRIQKGDDIADVLSIFSALEIVHSPAIASIDPDHEKWKELQSILPHAIISGKNEWLHSPINFKRLRLCSSHVPENIYDVMGPKGVCIIAGKPVQEGRIELLNYLQEQSVTTVYHRYGNLGEREIKDSSSVL